MSDPYTSHSTGKLKLKGVKDSKVSKSKGKGKKKLSSSSAKAQGDDSRAAAAGAAGDDEHQDKSVVLRHLEEEDAQIANEDRDLDPGRRSSDQAEAKASRGPRRVQIQGGGEGEDEQEQEEGRKTDAERRWDEQRRKRLEERLRREGVKTHKERVEELNRYLSGLSEHHDMPKIGPG